ncbi:MAG: shikimate dehydrogenase [Proteobacteria bacterium]|nr:shikimate dehydrogenase [Desulfobulbaceae bacterium]MBU4151795.1 shikimate dehydrogenase [Pseudomonadota bacterium]MDP2105358.1 shikimate dehydrogenase [Desulfobulbaceae bacterium]
MPVNGATEVYGILGNPVSHSLSPAMHNAAFQALGLNKVYVPFPAVDAGAAIQGFKALGIRGASVTIPHKQAVIPFLDSIDPVAAKIGAVNTLVINEGLVFGANTDWLGANAALKQLTPLRGKKVLLLGAGGSARAIGFGLLEEGAELTLASRTPATGQALAEVLGCPWAPLNSVIGFAADILINATSVGMGKSTGLSPVPREAVANFALVMDIVYSPLETLLLREAHAAGCRTINGLAMLLYQGVAQFERWTGVQAPVEIMRQELVTGMAGR